jgi:hypothetical protein
MMHIFPVSWEDHSTKAGYERIVLEVDDSNRDMIKDINNSEKGKQFLIVAYEIGEDAVEIQKLHNDKNAQKNNLLKRLYAMAGEYGEKTGLSPDTIKRILKAHLKGKKLIDKSLSELDESGLATAIYSLRVYLHPDRFDYSEYLKDEDGPDKSK